jgi:hypothetical protein
MDGNVIISLSALSFSLCVALMGLIANLTRNLMEPLPEPRLATHGQSVQPPQMDEFSYNLIRETNSFGKQFIGRFSPKVLCFLGAVFVFATLIRLACELPFNAPSSFALGALTITVDWEAMNFVFTNYSEALLLSGWLCFVGLLVLLDYSTLRSALRSRQLRSIQTIKAEKS